MTTKKWDPSEAERELLRARFTLWLDKTLARASAKCRSKMELDMPDEESILSIEAFPNDFFADPRDPYAEIEIGVRDFDFAEERIVRALAELPLMRREVLRLLFVELKKPKEVAQILCCSEDFVSLQKTRAIKKLRQLLDDGGKNE